MQHKRLPLRSAALDLHAGHGRPAANEAFESVIVGEDARGTFEGELVAIESVRICEGGCVRGSIAAARLSIEPGAVVDAEITVHGQMRWS